MCVDATNHTMMVLVLKPMASRGGGRRIVDGEADQIRKPQRFSEHKSCVGPSSQAGEFTGPAGRFGDDDRRGFLRYTIPPRTTG
jgi:hypothetical protein